jgi:hypothetical protein
MIDWFLFAACILYMFIPDSNRPAYIKKPSAFQNIASGILLYFILQIIIAVLSTIVKFVLGGNDV